MHFFNFWGAGFDTIYVNFYHFWFKDKITNYPVSVPGNLLRHFDLIKIFRYLGKWTWHFYLLKIFFCSNKIIIIVFKICKIRLVFVLILCIFILFLLFLHYISKISKKTIYELVMPKITTSCSTGFLKTPVTLPPIL